MRLANARQKASHGTGGKEKKIQFAKWDKLTDSRARFEKNVVTPNRILDHTFDEDGWPILPVNPVITAAKKETGTPGEARITGDFIGYVSVLTSTSKMSCISFSLAAGPLEAGGTCLASNLSKKAFSKMSEAAAAEGHYVDVEDTARGERAADIVAPGVKSIPKDRTMGTYICDLCYAGKGNYANLDSNQIYQIARKVWVDRHLAMGDFANIMVDLIGTTLSNDRLMLSMLTSSNYFRIHDSGDFFQTPGPNPFAYYDAWLEIARRLDWVRFWCPTRMWIIPKWRAYMAQSPIPPNMIIRPSALIYGAKAPKIVPLASGSTSSAESMMPHQHHDCPAYGSPEGSCAGAGCRVCWDCPEVPVNYKVH